MKAGTVPTEIECLLLSGIVLGVSRILPFNPPTLQYRQVLLSSSFYTNCWFINLLIPSFPPSLTYWTIMGPAPVIHSFNKHIPSILETFYRANCFDPKKAYYEHWRHSPRGPNVILRPHALCLEWSGCLTLHLGLLCCNSHLIPIVRTISLLFLLLPIMHWPLCKPQNWSLHIFALTILIVSRPKPSAS